MHTSGLYLTGYMGIENGADSSNVFSMQRGQGNGLSTFVQCNSNAAAHDEPGNAEYYTAYGVPAPDCKQGVGLEADTDGAQWPIVSTTPNAPTFIGRLEYLTGRTQSDRNSTEAKSMGIRIQPLAATPPGGYRALSVSQSNAVAPFGAETAYITMDGQAYFSGGLQATISGASNQADMLLRVNGGTWYRVYLGAANTCGSGFRCLAILN
jgi:hypothetical protein